MTRKPEFQMSVGAGRSMTVMDEDTKSQTGLSHRLEELRRILAPIGGSRTRLRSAAPCASLRAAHYKDRLRSPT
jgi:hypothetical protein